MNKILFCIYIFGILGFFLCPTFKEWNQYLGFNLTVIVALGFIIISKSFFNVEIGYPKSLTWEEIWFWAKKYKLRFTVKYNGKAIPYSKSKYFEAGIKISSKQLRMLSSLEMFRNNYDFNNHPCAKKLIGSVAKDLVSLGCAEFQLRGGGFGATHVEILEPTQIGRLLLITFKNHLDNYEPLLPSVN